MTIYRVPDGDAYYGGWIGFLNNGIVFKHFLPFRIFCANAFFRKEYCNIEPTNFGAFLTIGEVRFKVVAKRSIFQVGEGDVPP